MSTSDAHPLHDIKIVATCDDSQLQVSVSAVDKTGCYSVRHESERTEDGLAFFVDAVFDHTRPLVTPADGAPVTLAATWTCPVPDGVEHVIVSQRVITRWGASSYREINEIARFTR